MGSNGLFLWFVLEPEDCTEWKCKRGELWIAERKEKSILFQACNEANGGRQSRELTLGRRTRDLSTRVEGLKRQWREVKRWKGRQTDRNRTSLPSVNTEIYFSLKALKKIYWNLTPWSHMKYYWLASQLALLSIKCRRNTFNGCNFIHKNTFLQK